VMAGTAAQRPLASSQGRLAFILPVVYPLCGCGEVVVTPLRPVGRPARSPLRPCSPQPLIGDNMRTCEYCGGKAKGEDIHQCTDGGEAMRRAHDRNRIPLLIRGDYVLVPLEEWERLNA
jgi:hypothetical protein